MTINQVLAFCLVAVLVGFLVILAMMAVQAIDLLKKTKVLVNAGKEAVDEVKKKADDLTDGAMVAVNNVIADSSIGIKAVAAAGFGLTALNLATGAVKSLLRMVGLAPAKSTRKERRQAAKEIKLSKKTIREMNKQAKADRIAFAKAEKERKKLHAREMANAKREAKIMKAEQKVAAKLEAKEAKAAAKAAAIAAAAEAKALKAEKKAAVKALKIEQAIQAKAAKAEQAAAAIDRRLERRAKMAEFLAAFATVLAKRRAALKEAKKEKHIVKKAAAKAKKADKKQARKLRCQNKRAAFKAKRAAKKLAKKAVKKAAKNNK